MLTENARNRDELLHDFARSVGNEYFDEPDKEWSPILQHKYIMQPHLESFLEIEVRGLLRFRHNMLFYLFTWLVSDSQFSTECNGACSCTAYSLCVLPVHSKPPKGTVIDGGVFGTKQAITWASRCRICSDNGSLLQVKSNLCSFMHAQYSISVCWLLTNG